MGAAKTSSAVAAVAVALALLLPGGRLFAEPAVSDSAVAEPAASDPCLGTTDEGERFRICYDLGNRVLASGSNDGFGVGLMLRHVYEPDPDDVHWRIEHEMLSARFDGEHVRGTFYKGRFLRHSDDGRILIPIGRPKRIYLPFDIGTEVEVGRLDGNVDDGSAELGVIRAAALIEVLRSDTFRRRLTFGAAVRWDADVESTTRIIEHRVAPFTLATAGFGFESRNGLTRVDLRLDGGWEWSNVDNWQATARGEATVERILFAINDVPISIYGRGEFDAPGVDLHGEIGLRVAWPTTGGGPR